MADRGAVMCPVCKGPLDDGHVHTAPEHKVLVGRLYKEITPSWNEWKGVSFDEAVARMRSRREDDAPKVTADEIIEVVIVRRARITTEIAVEETPV